MTDPQTLAERVFAVVDGQLWDDYDTVFHPDVEMTSPFVTVHGTAEWVAFSRGFAAAMPDGRHTVTKAIRDGDLVAFEGSWTGTHTGPMAGPGGPVQPTGRTVTTPFCIVAHERDGRLASFAVHLDQLSMLAQLGLLPTPEPAAAAR